MKLMLDTVCYNHKPKNAGEITNRIIHNPVDITPQQLAEEVIKGKSFVPGYFGKKVNGKIKRRIENWTSQQIICLDFDSGMSLEEAINEFRNDAMFIYTTFNHTEEHHKFRVVFATEDEINNYDDYTETILNLMEKYPQVDQSCKDGSRLFYGGKDIHILDYNNRLPILYKSKINKNEYNGEKCATNKVLYIYSIGGTKTPLSSENVDIKPNNNIQYILNKDIKTIHNIINPIPKVFYTYTEIYEYINKQDLGLLLGVDKYFNCIFHNDSSPSASIFQNEEGSYIYKCFSDKCTFKTGTIRKCVERLLGCNKVESLKFLMEIYKIKHDQTDWQKEQKELLDENMRYLKSIEFQQDYPELYKRVNRYLGDLTLLHVIAKDNLPPEHYSEERVDYLFFTSLRHLANLKGVKDHKRLANILGLFVYLGLLFRLKEEDIADELLRNARKILSPKQAKMISFFSIPSYSDNILTFSEEKAIEFKDKHFTMQGWSREMLLRALGEEEANRVYPNMKNVSIGKYSEDTASLIEDVTMKIISNKGWATEKEILKHVELRKSYKEKQIKRILSEMLDKYGLSRIRLNKRIKQSMKIDVDGYPFIIIKGDKMDRVLDQI